MSKPAFSLPPRDGMSDAEYIPCLEESIRIMGEIILVNEQRLLSADSLLKAVLCSLPNRSVTLTQQSVITAANVDIKHCADTDGQYVLYAKERTHAKH